MPAAVGIANQLVATSSVKALLAKDATGLGGLAVYFSLATKQAPRPYLVVHSVSVPPAEHTMDGASSLSDGVFQFDSYADDQPTARKLSQAVRDALKNFVGALPDNTTIQFYEVALDQDDPYEQGGIGYVYRSVLHLKAFFTEPGE